MDDLAERTAPIPLQEPFVDALFVEYVKTAKCSDNLLILQVHLAHRTVEGLVYVILLLSNFEPSDWQIVKLFLRKNRSTSICCSIELFFLKEFLLLRNASDKLALDLFLMY